MCPSLCGSEPTVGIGPHQPFDGVSHQFLKKKKESFKTSNRKKKNFLNITSGDIYRLPTSEPRKESYQIGHLSHLAGHQVPEIYLLAQEFH